MPRFYLPALRRSQSLRWNWAALRLWVRDLLGFDPTGPGSARLYRILADLSYDSFRRRLDR